MLQKVPVEKWETKQIIAEIKQRTRGGSADGNINKMSYRI